MWDDVKMMNKNGVKLKDLKTTCADGDECTCHASSRGLCSVCKNLHCKVRVMLWIRMDVL